MPQRFKIREGYLPHFITSTVMHWIPIFCRQDYFGVLVNSLSYCIQNKGLVVHGYVLMPNHFHAIVSQAESGIPAVMRDLKRHTSTVLAQKLEEDGRDVWLRAFQKAGGEDNRAKVWMDQFHPEQIFSREFFDQKLGYMRNNPVRAGYVENPCHWKYSSAGFYHEGAESVVPVTYLEW